VKIVSPNFSNSLKSGGRWCVLRRSSKAWTLGRSSIFEAVVVRGIIMSVLRRPCGSLLCVSERVEFSRRPNFEADRHGSRSPCAFRVMEGSIKGMSWAESQMDSVPEKEPQRQFFHHKNNPFCDLDRMKQPLKRRRSWGGNVTLPECSR